MSNKEEAIAGEREAFVTRAQGFPRGVKERGGLITLHCPRCEWDFYMPIQPVYDLKFVAALIGVRPKTLVKFLMDRKVEYPRRYRWYSHQLRVRVLYAEEVQRIQKHYIRRHFKVANSVAAEQRDQAGEEGKEGPSGSV